MDDLVFGKRYRATEKIGSGGMADVFKAVDEVLGRTVAVKVMHPRFAAEPAFAQRFRQEAQSAANLVSPHIVNMYDWGQEDSTYYIVMEYVRGSDLKSIIEQKGALASAKVADIGAQVCSALSVAHGYDIIHRDIKPHNIMVQPDGSVKVMDFGIARAGNSTMTQTGSVLGTAHYVSPEQAQGKDLGSQSDLYSLGVVLYEAATGHLPFDADTPVAVALKQVNEQPRPPHTINNTIDPGLEAVIMKAMQKNPAERYQSADEMRRDLVSVAHGQQVAAAAALGAGVPRADETAVLPAVGGSAGGGAVTSVRRKNKPVWPWVLLALALLAAGLGVAWAAGVFGPPSAIVPDVVGKSRAEAQAILTDEGFVVGAVTEDFSDTIPAGAVMTQSPAAKSSAKKGSAISLVISKGPNLVEVPKVIGLPEADAFKALEAQGFSPQALPSEFNKDVAQGVVFKQTPDAGAKAPKGSVVSYVVSRGTELAQVPDVSGKTEADATSILKKAGFKVDTKSVYSDSVDKGHVISQNPPSGVSVAKGSTVTITVSKGTDKVTVPDLIGKSRTDAIAALKALGLKVNEVAELHANTGLVIDQDPESPADAPVKARIGDTIKIFVDEAAVPSP